MCKNLVCPFKVARSSEPRRLGSQILTCKANFENQTSDPLNMHQLYNDLKKFTHARLEVSI